MSILKVVNSLIMDQLDGVLDYNEFEKQHKELMKEVADYGISSGAISELVYYDDVQEFYNEYEEEILQFLDELGEVPSEPNLPIHVLINERVHSVVSSVAAEILFSI